MLTGSSMCGEPWAFCAPIETSSPYNQFLFTLMKGDSKKKTGLGIGHGSVWGLAAHPWQLQAELTWPKFRANGPM